MLGSIRHNLARLMQFSGRDTPATFWPYTLVLLGLSFVATFFAMIPAFTDMLARMQRFAAEHPDQATVEQGPGHYSIQIHGYHPELMPDFSIVFLAMACLSAAFALLVAAAVTRRLHDRGSSGLWALPPLLFLTIGWGLFPAMMGRIGESLDPATLLPTVLLLFLNNMLYLASLGWLLFLLIGAGTAGANRFGDDPRLAGLR